MRKWSAEFLHGFDDASIAEFLALAASEEELRELVRFLIEHRVELKEGALRQLERETEQLLARLHEVKREELLVELQCFKDTLALQRRLLGDARREG